MNERPAQHYSSARSRGYMAFNTLPGGFNGRLDGRTSVRVCVPLSAHWTKSDQRHGDGQIMLSLPTLLSSRYPLRVSALFFSVNHIVRPSAVRPDGQRHALPILDEKKKKTTTTHLSPVSCLDRWRRQMIRVVGSAHTLTFVLVAFPSKEARKNQWSILRSLLEEPCDGSDAKHG